MTYFPNLSYILQLYREMDGDWSCQVSVNAEKMIEMEQPIKGDSVRGFINFDPYASVTDEHNPVTCLSASLAPSNPFLFILTVAFDLTCRNGGNDKVRECCKFVDLFPSTQHFAAFCCNLPLVFGPRLDAEDALFFPVMHGSYCYRFPRTIQFKLTKMMRMSYQIQVLCPFCFCLISVLLYQVNKPSKGR